MSAPRPHSFFRRHAPLALKLLVSAGLLGLLFSRVDVARVWTTARAASPFWLAVAFGLYAVNVAASIWRWHVLLAAQHAPMGLAAEASSYLVALFFNNFLPSSIGGDVVRIRDSAKATGSMTLATAVVFVDRLLGLLGMLLVAACSASFAARGALPVLPAWLWAAFGAGAVAFAPAVMYPDGFGRLLRPLALLHPEWIGGRITQLQDVLARFRRQPGALLNCFAGAVLVQALTVLFYIATARGLRIPIGPWELAVIVPVSIVVQMAPVSVNGFGVREATFSVYFSRLGLPIESAVLLSLVATALIMVFSASGAVAYIARSRSSKDASGLS